MFLNLYQRQSLLDEYKKISLFFTLALFLHLIIFASFSKGLLKFNFNTSTSSISFTTPKSISLNLESKQVKPEIKKQNPVLKEPLIKDKLINDKKTAQSSTARESSASKASPQAKNKIYASYPPLAEELQIEGAVYMKFLADKSGKVIEVKVLKSSGSKLLDNAAIKALKTADFNPAKNKSGQAVSSWGEYTINFSLTES